ncbi:MAG: 1-acyl-sn-glycerol-3-phosphate acyltransferase [Bacteroidales bacterium]|nr:1-acyl-sn-glycerol-3-phosphate acyltransferase [Bacteroidales bacterium]
MTLYIPPTDYIYPKEQDDHMIKRKITYRGGYDENYTYLETNLWFRFKRFLFQIAFNVIALPIASLRFGLKVEGKKNIRKNKKILKQGFVSVSNHVLYWDYLVLQAAMFPYKAYTPAWEVNMSISMRHIYKLSGAIPIPKSNKAKLKFAESMNEAIKRKKWLHVYAEGSMWYHYVPIRPFKKGAFLFAYTNQIPVPPIVFTFRKPTGIYAWFKTKEPLVTVHIGELQYANYEMKKAYSVEELKERCRQIMMQMAGIENEAHNQELMEKYTYNTGDEPILYKCL